MAFVVTLLCALGLVGARGMMIGHEFTPNVLNLAARAPLRSVFMQSDLPVSKSSTLSELRAVIAERGLDIKTTGKGRTKKVIFKELAALCLSDDGCEASAEGADMAREVAQAAKVAEDDSAQEAAAAAAAQIAATQTAVAEEAAELELAVEAEAEAVAAETAVAEAAVAAAVAEMAADFATDAATAGEAEAAAHMVSEDVAAGQDVEIHELERPWWDPKIPY